MEKCNVCGYRPEGAGGFGGIGQDIYCPKCRTNKYTGQIVSQPMQNDLNDRVARLKALDEKRTQTTGIENLNAVSRFQFAADEMMAVITKLEAELERMKETAMGHVDSLKDTCELVVLTARHSKNNERKRILSMLDSPEMVEVVRQVLFDTQFEYRTAQAKAAIAAIKERVKV